MANSKDVVVTGVFIRYRETDLDVESSEITDQLKQKTGLQPLLQPNGDSNIIPIGLPHAS